MTALTRGDLPPGLPPISIGQRRRPPRGALRPGLTVVVLYLALVCLVALVPGLFVGDPGGIDPVNALQGPSPAHLFGTDQLGHDIFARVVYGARASLTLGLGATALAAIAGVAWGLAAGLGGRIIDEAAMRLADIFMSVPPTLMALLIVAVGGAGGVSVAVAIAVALSPGFARVVRVQALVVSRAGYVQAATIAGLPRHSVLARHIVPNVLPPMLVLATMNVGQSIIAGASLSFLGLGPEPSSDEWGSMLSQARDYLSDAWAPAVFPGLAITLTVISIGVLGRELQTRFEGRGR